MRYSYGKTLFKYAQQQAQTTEKRCLSTQKPSSEHNLFLYAMGTFVTSVFSFTVYQAVRIQLIMRESTKKTQAEHEDTTPPKPRNS